MIPPKEVDVLDKHGGFAAITTPAYGSRKRFPAIVNGRYGNTLWRSGNQVLRGRCVGTLVEYIEKTFYQLNDDVSMGVYKVPGYSYPVAIWFDNKTGKRIA